MTDGASTDGGFVAPVERVRLYEQVAERISHLIEQRELSPGDRLPPERELASALGVSRATLSQALVALEVIGVVEVRHGGGTIVTRSMQATSIVSLIRERSHRMQDILDTRDALETKLASLAASSRTDADMARIDAAIDAMQQDVDAGGRGLEGDEAFHAAVTAAAHAPLLAQLMAEISELIRTTRIESLSQPDRPRNSIGQHRAIADAIRSGEAEAAALAMHSHIDLVRDVPSLREP